MAQWQKAEVAACGRRSRSSRGRRDRTYQGRLFAEDALQGSPDHRPLPRDVRRGGDESAIRSAGDRDKGPAWQEPIRNSKNDLLAIFVERGTRAASSWRARLGAITSRTCFFPSRASRNGGRSCSWSIARPEVMADLGSWGDGRCDGGSGRICIWRNSDDGVFSAAL